MKFLENNGVTQSNFFCRALQCQSALETFWRFPFTAYENGGGAFLIPYIIVLVLIGKPLYYMELCMGQFASYGSVKVWAMVPAFRDIQILNILMMNIYSYENNNFIWDENLKNNKSYNIVIYVFSGIGYGQAIATWCVVTYYVSLMALTIFYFIASFFPKLPWASCNILKLHPGGLDDGIYAPDWKLTLCLLFSWIILFLILVQGVKSSGKSAYFTALFPYVVLIIMLGRGASLPGAVDGIWFFINPDWKRILEPTVWFKAVGQSFFSLSVGFGSIIMFSSYNNFRHNVYRDVTIISVVDTLTSFLAGLTIFGILGHLAHETGLPVSDVVSGGGSGLAFISYPDVLSRFNVVPQLFAVLFFLMLFTLGVGSASALTGCIITIIQDKFPDIPKYLITIFVCIAGFLLGLFYVTPQGQFILDLVDYFGGVIVAVNYVYGMKNFIRDIEFMLGRKTGIYWRICWSLIIPIFLFYIFITTVDEAVKKGFKSGGYVFKGGAIAFGVCLALFALILVPVFIGLTIYRSYKEKRQVWEALKLSFTATEEWGPKDSETQEEYQEFLRMKKEFKTLSTKEYLDVKDEVYRTPFFHFRFAIKEFWSFIKELYWND
ncbi:Sodium-dependent nutrient amino acid transporter 1 [Armadillidium nasatum]|uniref:Transporter n=1 Tax=Armadillidium nasatum TaxID=96803 RepID=A0A5N5TIJ3_9CRUS|nr:Sodium-dependent nutrient amino acid transporter 1 [Armadillidium nasatum]